MDRSEILELLDALAERLVAREVQGEMYVVGGAAIALAFDERRSTRDIDAVFEPKQLIYQEAERLAEERGLPPGWLNDAVKGFLAGADTDSIPILELPGLRVSTASTRMLLAMKVLAHRVGEDEDDLRMLACKQRTACWLLPRMCSEIVSMPPLGSSSWSCSQSPSSTEQSGCGLDFEGHHHEANPPMSTVGSIGTRKK
jgi:hypothetical protein